VWGEMLTLRHRLESLVKTRGVLRGHLYLFLHEIQGKKKDGGGVVESRVVKMGVTTFVGEEVGEGGGQLFFSHLASEGKKEGGGECRQERSQADQQWRGRGKGGGEGLLPLSYRIATVWGGKKGGVGGDRCGA